MKRCKWVNEKNNLYKEYHDHEWGVLNKNEHYLFEMFILECFQAGLSWECILNKREYFNQAYDNFDIDKIICYDDFKVTQLMNNPYIIRNKGKIKASIENAKIFKRISKEYGSFFKYLMSFGINEVIFETNRTTNDLSNKISNDLKRKGMKYVGSITIYSYLQAVGIINSHEKSCFLYKGG